MLSRMPASSLADLHKGDAVILVSTEGTAGVGTAIQLVSGVEPILQAAPNAGQAMMLAPWSLGGAPPATLGVHSFVLVATECCIQRFHTEASISWNGIME